MDEKLLLIERKFEKLKFTNEKNSVDFENNEANIETTTVMST